MKVVISNDDPIESLRNLGPTSSRWLRATGIHTVGDLKNIGAAVAFRMVRQQRPQTSLNLLWAMAAGLVQEDWRRLDDTQKRALRMAVDSE